MPDRVRAVVRVTLDVEAGSVWSDDTTWGQIAKQAEDDVKGMLTGSNTLVLKELPGRIVGLRVVQVVVRKEE